MFSGKSILTKSTTLAAVEEAEEINRANIRLAALAGSTSQEFVERAIPLMADGRLNLKPLITHTFSLDEIRTAFATFTGRIGGAVKVIVKP